MRAARARATRLRQGTARAHARCVRLRSERAHVRRMRMCNASCQRGGARARMLCAYAARFARTCMLRAHAQCAVANKGYAGGHECYVRLRCARAHACPARTQRDERGAMGQCARTLVACSRTRARTCMLRAYARCVGAKRP
eukprot:806378-Pleurochrysis_carterae.AAC.2